MDETKCKETCLNLDWRCREAKFARFDRKLGAKSESFDFLGFEFAMARSCKEKWVSAKSVSMEADVEFQNDKAWMKTRMGDGPRKR
jgi:hypothetical protein